LIPVSPLNGTGVFYSTTVSSLSPLKYLSFEGIAAIDKKIPAERRECFNY
jgi:hypothetical protein